MIVITAVIGGGGALAAWYVLNGLNYWHLRKVLRERVRPFDSKKFGRKIKKIHLKPFPDFLELLALGVSAGFSIEVAWERAATFLPDGVLAKELVSTLHSIRWGCPREEALHRLATRLEDKNLAMIFSLLEQAMKKGNLIEPVLIEQARILRQSRFSAMEKSAQTAGVRLLFPILFLILPAVFLIMFAPLFIRFSQGVALF